MNDQYIDNLKLMLKRCKWYIECLVEECELEEDDGEYIEFMSELKQAIDE